MYITELYLKELWKGSIKFSFKACDVDTLVLMLGRVCHNTIL